MDGAALRAAFGQRFALPQWRLWRPISLELLRMPLRVSVIEVARAITHWSQAGIMCDQYPKLREKGRTSF